jgi:menaquinone-dependent protoporphyrinogen IX oxidase
MNRTVVVYRSKYGTTKQYATWIAQDTGADLMDLKTIHLDDLFGYDAIVFCGGLYAGGILGFTVLKKHDDLLKEKRLIVVAVGATLKGEAAKEEIRKKNFTPNMQHAQLFLLRGGLNYKKMGFVDRLLMGLLVRNIKATPPEKRDNESKGILATYGKSVNFVDRNTIIPVVAAVKG